MSNISIIVAIARNNAIGLNNQLLWHIPEDLKRFKRLTEGHHVIMGKRTYESLPVRPLKNRINVVMTDNRKETFEGCVTVYSIEEAIRTCEGDVEAFVIGGGSVYAQFLPLASKLYITKVDQAFEADTYFPDIDLSQWKLVAKEDHGPDERNDFSYSYLVYQK